MVIFSDIAGNLLSWAGLANIPATIESLRTMKGSVGQVVCITEVGSTGQAAKFGASSAAGVTLDTSLTQSGQAADAKAVGDALGRYINDVDALIGGDG